MLLFFCCTKSYIAWVCRPRWLSWMCIQLVIRRLWVQPPPGRQHSFMEIDREIFSTVIHSLLLIQEYWLTDQRTKPVQ